MTVLVPTVNGAPVSLTPPPRFNVLEPPLIVPAVLVIETVPVVVKPAILFAATVPPRVTSYEPKFNVPPPVLVRFPWMVKFVLAPAVPVPLNCRF